MRRGTVLIAAIAAAIACVPAAASSQLCVGKQPGCFATIAEALDAAQDGDTIAIGPGTFAGGIAITKSVNLVGVSAGATTIAGGGPVLTIGELDGTRDLTVSIARVTIRGGRNRSTPQPFVATGGGVWIPPRANFETGATVTISDSVVTGNRVDPETAFDFCGHPCAFATGAGIANAGTLTVANTTISDNVSGSTETDQSVASYAAAGGIENEPPGSLTLLRSSVVRNRAAVSVPNGRNTDAGAIASYGELAIDESVLNGNRSEVDAAVPSTFPDNPQQEANAGGLYLAPGSTSTIRRSSISGNSVQSSNTAGDVMAEAGGIDSDGLLTLSESVVDRNTVVGIVPARSGFLVEADAGGIQVQHETTARDTVVTNNTLSSTSASGAALASGGGIFNLSATATLERTLVARNSATATGLGGFNLGGGIANVLFGGGPPVLALTSSVLMGNRIAASPGVVSLGGGLYTADPFTGATFPVAMTRTLIAGNTPSQCFGC